MHMRTLLHHIWVWLTCWTLSPVLFCHTDCRIVQTFGAHARKIRCNKCGRYFAMNDETDAIIPWDADLEELYGRTFGCGRTIR